MDLRNIKKEAEKEINSAEKQEELKEIFQKYLGKRGEITQILRSLKGLSEKEKKKIGNSANQLKEYLFSFIKEKEISIKEKELERIEEGEYLDMTIPGKKIFRGHLHPITQIRRRVEEIFEKLGFSVTEGPEIEDEWYNFDALNIPKDHPARDRWDTFWLEDSGEVKKLLRTHTSPVQARYMEKNNPPLKIIAPGRVFRYEATDASHEINFYHIEGLMVDKKVTLADFKGIMEKFFKLFFEKDTKIRLRPSYFPFTEPSIEIDVKCLICKGKGCSICSQRGWIEMAGAGMVHPQVFESVKLNSKNWQGFAFGMGLDRLTMMKYKINDIRLFFNGDLRFLEQF